MKKMLGQIDCDAKQTWVSWHTINMPSVTTESAADTVVFSAPATDVHSAPSNKGDVATTDVLPTI